MLASRRAVLTRCRSSLLTNLVAWWSFDKLGSDLHGKHVLTNINGVTLTTGVGGNAGAFTIVGANKLQAATTVMQPNNKDFTIAGWFKQTTQNSEMDILGSFSTGPMLTVLNSTLRFYISGAGGSLPWGSAISTATWYFFACSYTATSGLTALGVNAATPATSTLTANLNLSGNAFALGAYAGPPSAPTGQFNGSIGPVGYWESLPGRGGVLNARQITALYNSGRGRAYPFTGVMV